MKIKDNFVLRQVADTWCVLPLAEETLNLNGMLTLNDSGAFLWKTLEGGAGSEELAAALMGEYEVDPQTAEADINEFLDKLRHVGCLVE